MSERIRVGQIVNTQGIRGEVRLYPLTDDLARFQADHPYYIEGSEQKVHIESFRPLKNLVVLKFKEFQNINEVLPFKGEYLTVEKEHQKKLSEDEYFLYELEGLTVLDEEGNLLGHLVEVIKNAANDVYRVETCEKKTLLVPAVKEFVLSVDRTTRTMTIRRSMWDEI